MADSDDVALAPTRLGARPASGGPAPTKDKSLVEAATTGAFLAAPKGAYVLGRCFLYFQTAEDLTGYLLWGAPASEDIDALVLLIRASVARLPPHPSLVDARAVDGAPLQLFERLAAFVRENHGELRGSLTRLALVRGGGVTGAVVSGFFDVVAPPYPVESFETLDVALAWLDVPEPHLLAAELEDLRERASQVPPLVRQLRALLDTALPQPDEAAAARALGLSSRTLQRRLAELGTTFAGEVSQVRVARAVTLLETTDEPLTRIAFDIGCPSLSRFSTLVKKLTGETPSALRARKRGGKS